MTPAAIPCINRPKLIPSVSEIPLIIEPMINIVIMIALVRRSPKIEMNQAAETIPAVIAAKYLDTIAALYRNIPKAPIMSRATLPVVIESTTVMAPITWDRCQPSRLDRTERGRLLYLYPRSKQCGYEFRKRH